MLSISEFHYLDFSHFTTYSVATYLSGGGKHDKDFIANFLLNSTVKEV